MKKILVLLISSFLAVLATAQPELKGSPQDLKQFLYPNDRVMTIYGKAEEKAYSNRAIISLVITTENKLLSAAITDNSSLRASVNKMLINAGLSEDAIKSSKFSSSPQYGWFGKKPASYKIVNRMAITIDNETHLKEIATVADKFEAVVFSDTVFEHKEKDAYKQKVKARALKKIKQQKDFYEQSLGVKLTPIGIRDSNIRQRATRGAMVLEEVLITAQKVSRDSVSAPSKYRQQPQESSFDEVLYEANLAVDYKIEPATTNK